jgi:hypothetical protein
MEGGGVWYVGKKKKYIMDGIRELDFIEKGRPLTEGERYV